MSEITTRDLTCIICPRGCALHIEFNDGQITSVTGNTCPRGKQYAIDECTHPVRTVTSTVRTDRDTVVPVKTNKPIPRELMLDCMAVIRKLRVTLPVRIGDVAAADILGTGADLIVTADAD